VAAEAESAPGGVRGEDLARQRRRRRKGRRAPGEPRNIGWLYAAPGIAFFLLFTLFPLAHAAWISLFSWDGLTPKEWRGLGNYREALGDPLVHSAFLHALVLMIFYAVLPIIIGLALAGFLTRHPLRGFTFYRTALFLPQMIAGVVVAQAWTWLYNGNGPINRVLGLVGLSSLERAWLGDFTWVLPSVGVIGTWVSYGLCLVLFVAGVQKIDQSLYDAARVDGAGPFREFFAVTLPGLRNELVVASVLTVIGALRGFDVIYNATGGGPGTQTTVPAVLMYRNAFTYNKVGYAASIAVILAIAIVAVATLINSLGSRETET
jgi:raffinose/stachyose/melibiose transport system permease protein